SCRDVSTPATNPPKALSKGHATACRTGRADGQPTDDYAAGIDSLARPADRVPGAIPAYDERGDSMSAPPARAPSAVTVRTFRPNSRRRILCVFPVYTKAFATFDHAFPLMGPVKAFMPPQGILLIAALLPAEWQVRFVDENV